MDTSSPRRGIHLREFLGDDFTSGKARSRNQHPSKHDARLDRPEDVRLACSVSSVEAHFFSFVGLLFFAFSDCFPPWSTLFSFASWLRHLPKNVSTVHCCWLGWKTSLSPNEFPRCRWCFRPAMSWCVVRIVHDLRLCWFREVGASETTMLRTEIDPSWAHDVSRLCRRVF